MTRTRNNLITYERPAEGDWIQVWKQDRSFVTALGRGLEILRCFCELTPELSVSEIARMISLPQPTTWRLCHTLMLLGYLVPAQGKEKLRIGTAVLALGHSALPSVSSEDTLRPLLQKAADRFHASVGIADRNRLSMIYLLRCQSQPRIAMTGMRVGTRIELHKSAIGWAYLVGLSKEARSSLLQQMKSQLGRQWPQVEKHITSALQQHANQGFVVNCGVLVPGLNTAAVPLHLPDGTLLAMNCSGPASLLPLSKLHQEIGPELLRLAGSLSKVLPSRAETL